MVKNNTVCRLAWTGLSIQTDGRTRPCCISKDFNVDEQGRALRVQYVSVNDILRSGTMVNLRNQMRNGEQPAGCVECWQDEERGHTSKRQFYTTEGHFEDNVEWDKEPDAVSELQVALDNNCNLKCRTCGPSCSSKWAAEAVVVNSKLHSAGKPIIPAMLTPTFPYGHAGDDASKFWIDRHEWIASIRRLEIVGGEPLYAKQWHTMLRDIADTTHANQVSVSISTNGFIYYKNIVEEIGPKLKTLNLPMSIDGTGTVFEYLRHPAKWDKVESNMLKYNSMHDQYSTITSPITATLSWINALNIHKLFAFKEQHLPKQHIWVNLVRGPEHFALWAIPTALKDAIRDNFTKTNYPDVDGILKFMYSNSITDEEFIENLKIIRISDLARNENLIDSVPELIPYISKHWDLATKDINEL